MKVVVVQDESKRKGPKGIYPQGQLCLTPKGKRFHYRHCRTLKKSHSVKALHPESPPEVLREARTRDRCKVCRPPAGGALKVVGESIMDHALIKHPDLPWPAVIARKMESVATGRGWKAIDYGARAEMASLGRKRYPSAAFLFALQPGSAEEAAAWLAKYEAEQREALQVPEPEPKPKPKRDFKVVKPQDPFKGFAPA